MTDIKVVRVASGPKGAPGIDGQPRTVLTRLATLPAHDQTLDLGHTYDDPGNNRTVRDPVHVDLRAFGAKANDPTFDNAAAITAWLTAAYTERRVAIVGGSIDAATQDVFYTSKISWPSAFAFGITVRGAGRYKTIFKSIAGDHVFEITNGGAFSTGTLEDFGVDGGIPTNASGQLVGFSPKTCTVDAPTDTVTSAGHGYANGQRVVFSTTVAQPGGIRWDSTYFVINATTNTFQIAVTPGGAAVDITSAGTGTLSVGAINGTGHGLFIHTGRAIGFEFSRLRFANCGGSGFKCTDGVFSSTLRVVEVDRCFDHGLNFPGGIPTALHDCYWHNVPTAGTYGCRILTGAPEFYSCNGIDGGLGGCVLLGADGTHDGDTQTGTCNATFRSCNFEALTGFTPGLQTRLNSSVRGSGHCEFLVTNQTGVIESNVIAMQMDAPAAGGYIDSAVFNAQGGATWKDGLPIHLTASLGGVPPTIRGQVLDGASAPITTYRDDSGSSPGLPRAIVTAQLNSIWTHDFPGIRATVTSTPVHDIGTAGASPTVFWLQGDFQQMTLAQASTAIAMGSANDGQICELHLIQGSGGNKLVSGYGANVDFGAAGPPTLSTAAGKRDILRFRYVAGVAKFVCIGVQLGMSA